MFNGRIPSKDLMLVAQAEGRPEWQRKLSLYELHCADDLLDKAHRSAEDWDRWEAYAVSCGAQPSSKAHTAA